MSNEINRADGELGWLLRADYDGLAREPLPERWTELIRTLDEKHRLKLKTDMRMEAEGIRTNADVAHWQSASG